MFTGHIGISYGAYHWYYGGAAVVTPRNETPLELEGESWELGVLVPYKNLNFDYFEKQFTLLEDVDVGAVSVKVYGDLIWRKDIFPGQKLFIGPSSNTFRDSNGIFKYKNFKEERAVASIPYNRTDYDNWYTQINFTPSLVRRYNKGDNITLRGLAQGWNHIYEENNSADESMISDVRGLGVVTLNSNFPPEATANTMGNAGRNNFVKYERTDPLFEYKGHAQKIFIKTGSSGASYGFRQNLSKQHADYFHNLVGKKIRFSGWFRMTGKGSGLKYPYIGFVFYNSIFPKFSNEIMFNNFADASIVNLNINNGNLRWLRKAVTVPSNAENAALYAVMQVDEDSSNVDCRYEYILAEHAIGTCQEDNGYYVLPKKPKIGMPINTNKRTRRNRLASGDLFSSKTSNPLLRISLSMDYEEVDEHFLHDMRVFESYSDNNNLIVLRPTMFESLPPVLIGKFKMEEPIPVKFSRGGLLYNVRLHFREVVN